MLQDEEDSKFRDYSKDSLTVVDWLEGSYPNFFFAVNIDDVNLFAERYEALQNRDDYEHFVIIDYFISVSMITISVSPMFLTL